MSDKRKKRLDQALLIVKAASQSQTSEALLVAMSMSVGYQLGKMETKTA